MPELRGKYMIRPDQPIKSLYDLDFAQKFIIWWVNMQSKVIKQTKFIFTLYKVTDVEIFLNLDATYVCPLKANTCVKFLEGRQKVKMKTQDDF